MKKIILLLITLTTLTNVSYASFPVAETQQTEIVESINSELPTYRSGNPVWGILSLSCALLSIILMPNLLAIVSISLLGVIFGAIGFNKKLKGLAITGFVLSLILLIISLVALVIFILFGGVGAAFGG
jgi:hypothetical protein